MRDALVKDVAENIISYIKDNQMSPGEYLYEILGEETIWRIIGTIKLCHYYENIITNRSLELEYFLQLTELANRNRRHT